MINITILGATGSIGKNTLELVRKNPEKFNIVGLTANKNVKKMIDLVNEFKPDLVAMADNESYIKIQKKIKCDVYGGKEGIDFVASNQNSDTIVAGIVGYAGLSSIMSAIDSDKRVLLANKEALVCAGPLLVTKLKKSKATILPIDSEHNAIFQCLGKDYKCFFKPNNLKKIILTASGGPFRTWTKESMANATVKQAISHPNWKMGEKISVDSATMMNKGLEMIEAHWLFCLKNNEIEVLIHPESIIHSMIEFSDRSSLAQLSVPDMKVPIAHGLTWPDRFSTHCSSIDWRNIKKITFEEVDTKKFPAIKITRLILNEGNSAGCVLNSANEIAVEAFLEKKINFGKITYIIEKILDKFSDKFEESFNSLEELEDFNNSVRVFGKSLI